MTRLTISMPDQLSAYVEGQIAQGRYGNVSEYFRDLIRRDQERRSEAIAELRTMIEKAEASGTGTRSMTEIREAVIAEARQQGLLND